MTEEKNNSDRISQAELDELLRFSYVETDEFRLDCTLTAEKIPLITISGKALGANAAQLAAQVCARFKKVRGDILLEMSGCTFLTSLALEVILGLATQRHKMGSKVIAIGVNPQIRNTMQAMGMDEWFTLVDDMPTAIAQYKKSPRRKHERPCKKCRD